MIIRNAAPPVGRRRKLVKGLHIKTYPRNRPYGQLRGYYLITGFESGTLPWGGSRERPPTGGGAPPVWFSYPRFHSRGRSIKSLRPQIFAAIFATQFVMNGTSTGSFLRDLTAQETCTTRSANQMIMSVATNITVQNT